jgi:hypothetical protein
MVRLPASPFTALSNKGEYSTRSEAKEIEIPKYS